MKLGIQGVVSGSINDQPVLASCGGFLDTTGQTVNHFSLLFVEPVPKGFNPIVAGNCWGSSYHGNAVNWIDKGGSRLSSFTSMYDTTYITSRTVSGLGLNLEFKSRVTRESGLLVATDSTVNGYYDGPLDIVGVANYRQIWDSGESGDSVVINVTADLARANGELIPVSIVTKYSNLTSREAVFTARSVNHVFGNQSWDGYKMNFDWVAIGY